MPFGLMNILLDDLSHLFRIVVWVVLGDPRIGAILLFISSRFRVVLLDSVIGKLTAWGVFSLVNGEVAVFDERVF